MRALIIMCESQHYATVRAELLRHVHSQVAPSMTAVIACDIEGERRVDGQWRLLDFLRRVPPHTTNIPLVVATREVNNALALSHIVKHIGVDLEVTSSGELRKSTMGKRKSPLHSRVNNCNLSQTSVAAAMLATWNHDVIGQEHLSQWIEQFGRLDGHAWMAHALLGLFHVKAAPDLCSSLCGVQVEPDEVPCVNRDPRGGFKSAEVVGNYLTKHLDRRVYGGPAEAIEEGAAKRLILFEDGLWSGTEAIGIVDSLLGRRDDRLKTRRLVQPDLLRATDVRMVYGVVTDYGRALVQRVLTDRDLGHIQIMGVQNIEVAQPQLLQQIADPETDIRSLIEAGPPEHLLRPYVFNTLRESGMSDEMVGKLRQFCKEVGQQLFRNYVQQMCVHKGWTMWSDDKLGHAALGMHGLALSHAFSHSIPKASLPLFWGSGSVQLGHKTVNWRPLLPNN